MRIKEKKWTEKNTVGKFAAILGKACTGRRAILSPALLFALLFVFGGHTALAASTEPDDDVGDNSFSYYLDNSNHCLTITGNGTMSSIHLATEAGKGQKFVVKRPWGNTGAEAKKIKSVHIGDGITTIPDGTFSRLTNLVSVSLPPSLESIGNYAFYGCSSLKSVKLPDGVQSIGKEAFYGCKSLTTLHLGESLESIGSCAFWGTRKLTDMTLDTANENFRMVSGVLYSSDRKTAWLYPAGLTKTPQLSPKTVSIANGAFAYSSIPSIEIPSTTVKLNGGTFYKCSNLKKVTFAKKSSCTALSSLNRYNGSGSPMKYGTFQGCRKLSAFTAPAKLKSIAASSFIDCKSMKTLALGKGFRSFTTSAGKKTPSLDTSGMKNLESITVSAKNPKYYSDEKGCLYLKSSRQPCVKPVHS